MKTIDKHCGQPEGAFKKYIASLNKKNARLEMDRVAKLRKALKEVTRLINPLRTNQ